MNYEKIDYVVLGGGFFGLYSSYLLSNFGSVLLLESDEQLFSRASMVNQTRLHTGAHYPRSPITALKAIKNSYKFKKEFSTSVNDNFEHYYGIDNLRSAINPEEFERFCNFIKIEYQNIHEVGEFKNFAFKKLYKIQEYAFDPLLLKKSILNKLSKNVSIKTNTKLNKVYKDDSLWYLEIKHNGKFIKIKTPYIVNATYSNLNSILHKFKLPLLNLKFEIANLLILENNKFRNLALTVIDGPFISLTPYGKTNLSVLSSVNFSHPQNLYTNGTKIACQSRRDGCSNLGFDKCMNCKTRIESFNKIFFNQLQKYVFIKSNEFNLKKILTTVKTTQNKTDYRDSRPTIAFVNHVKPTLVSILSGKISSIYDLEEFFDV